MKSNLDQYLQLARTIQLGAYLITGIACLLLISTVFFLAKMQATTVSKSQNTPTSPPASSFINFEKITSSEIELWNSLMNWLASESPRSGRCTLSSSHSKTPTSFHVQCHALTTITKRTNKSFQWLAQKNVLITPTPQLVKKAEAPPTKKADPVTSYGTFFIDNSPFEFDPANKAWRAAP